MPTNVDFRGQQVELETTDNVMAIFAFADSDNPVVRAGLARNPRTPEHAKLKYAADDSFFVVYALITGATPGNPLTREVQQAIMANTANIRALVYLPKAAGVSDDVVVALCRHPLAAARAAAAGVVKDSGVLSRLANDRTVSVRRAVALNTHASEDVLRRLAQDKHDSVRCAVASRSDVQFLMLSLSRDLSESVLATLARNTSLTVEAQHAVAASGSEYARRTLMYNASAAPEVIRQVFASAGDREYRTIERAVRLDAVPLDERARLASRSRSSRVRTSFFESLTQDEISVLCESTDERVQQYASRYLVRTVLA